MMMHTSVTLRCVRRPVYTLSSCPGGDISTKNLWLAESVLDILLDQKYVFLNGLPAGLEPAVVLFPAEPVLSLSGSGC